MSSLLSHISIANINHADTATTHAHRFLFCAALFFMCGTLGVWGASQFVSKIYRNVKID